MEMDKKLSAEGLAMSLRRIGVSCMENDWSEVDDEEEEEEEEEVEEEEEEEEEEEDVDFLAAFPEVERESDVDMS